MTDHTIPADQDATTDRRGRATYLSPETIARTVERGIEQAHRYDTADQGDTIPADKLREIIAAHYAENEGDGLKSDLLALLPESPLPTLADMTVEERDECQWMQADTEQWGRVVITQPCESGIQAVLLTRQGYVIYERYTRITPRPDLPRMEWPGEQKPSPTLPDGWRLADHPVFGRGIVTQPTPDRDGYVYFVCSDNTLPKGYNWHLYYPDELTFLDTAQEKNND